LAKTRISWHRPESEGHADADAISLSRVPHRTVLNWLYRFKVTMHASHTSYVYVAP
jgi:hypothetical protein